MSKLAAKGDLKALIKALGYQRDWLVRRQAVVALKSIGGARAIEALVGALGDSNSIVREESAQALAMLGVSSVEPPVETPSDGYSGANDSEADAVGQSGDAQTVEASTATLVEPTPPKMATGRGGDGPTRAAASTVAGAQTGPPDGMRIGTDPDVMYDLGGTLYEEGDPGGARIWYEKAVAVGHPGAMNNLGVLLREQGDMALLR